MPFDLFGTGIVLDLYAILARILGLCIAFCVHELAHAYIASHLGYPCSVKEGGIGFNPLRRIAPVGLICMLLFRFGWSRAPVVEHAKLEKPRSDSVIVALFGPFASLIFAFVLILVLYPLTDVVGEDSFIFWIFLETFVYTLAIALFNLLPIPPLDGAHIFLTVVPSRMFAFVHNPRTVKVCTCILAVLVVFGVVDLVFIPAIGWLQEQITKAVAQIWFFI
jgi:Zn-dependent protease